MNSSPEVAARRIGILYVCTGRYEIFWRAFYESCERYLLAEGSYEKHYFVFTDAPNVAFEGNGRVNRFFQQGMPWPYPTLYRFKFFHQIEARLEAMDVLFFFNANAQFVAPIGAEILPTPLTPLVVAQHPTIGLLPREKFPYETNPKSLAYVSPSEGEHYFMGSISGGICKNYLDMVRELDRRTRVDEQNGLIAVWHDESHLNRYAIDHADELKILSASYCYPEELQMPIKPLIMLRSKRLYGGHQFMRGGSWWTRSYFSRTLLRSLIFRCKRKLQGLLQTRFFSRTRHD